MYACVHQSIHGSMAAYVYSAQNISNGHVHHQSYVSASMLVLGKMMENVYFHIVTMCNACCRLLSVNPSNISKQNPTMMLINPNGAAEMCHHVSQYGITDEPSPNFTIISCCFPTVAISPCLVPYGRASLKVWEKLGLGQDSELDQKLCPNKAG